MEEPVAGSSSAATESGDVLRLIEAVTTEEETGHVTSPTLDQLGRQHSILRATGLTETDRAAALKARHRVRATTMGSTVRRKDAARGAAKVAAGRAMEEEEHDTDEETNGGGRICFH